MNKQTPSSITLEDAVALMVNMDYIPPGVTLFEMTGAFQIEAEVEYENALHGFLPDGLNGPLSDDLIARLKTRMEACEARHSLAQFLIDALSHELGDPESSFFILKNESSMQYLTLESVSDWASEKFGIGIPGWPHAGHDTEESVKEFRWEDLTIKIYAHHKIGCIFSHAEYKRMSFQEIGLMGKRKNAPNKLGAILIGLSLKKKFPNGKVAAGADKTAISKLRHALVKLTGKSGEPFYRYNEGDGWKPRFKLIDDRKNADKRAKEQATHVSLDETRDFDNENDSAGKWFSENND